MSVVNRMLLDIDRRHGAAEVLSKGPFPDIRSVPAAAKPKPRNSNAFMLIAVAGMGIAVAGLNYVGVLGRNDPGAVPVGAPAKPAVHEPAPQVAMSPPPVVPPAVDQPAVVAPVAVTPVVAAPVVVTRAAAAPKPVESFKLSRQLSPVVEKPAAVAPPPKAAIVVSGAPVKSVAPIRQVAADETVATARALWNSGSRAAAIATLNDALLVAEGARNPAAIGPIAGEAARLEIADNRPQVALELLRRNEASLADDAEAWALRGNAEQRLALHSDSARSYLAALRLRPVEARWMLGAAISLAAEGKPDEAQAWAERARDRGVVTPAIEAYLQQLGVKP